MAPAVPDQAIADLLQTFVSRYPAKKIILLSFFDGIGAAPLALHVLAGEPLLVLAWDTDTACQQITSTRLPYIQHRGDALTDNYREVAAIIQKADPSAACLLLITGGPPCPDFSKIVNKDAGRDKEEGAKFTRFTDILKDLQTMLPDHNASILVENVVMADPSDTAFYTEQLQAEPVLVDSADSSFVSRPRLWWSRLKRQDIKQHPLTGKPLKWTQNNRHRQLKMSLPPQQIQDIHMGKLTLHPDVVQGRKKIPCFTTPSPDQHGCDAPSRHRSKVDEGTKQRWLADNRCFAPWQYSPHAMAYNHDNPQVIPAHIKEQIHNFPHNWTSAGNTTERTRHRLVANSWRMSVAIFVMALLLQFSGSQATFTVPNSPKDSSIDAVLQLGNALMAMPGPGRWALPGTAFPQLPAPSPPTYTS